VNAPFRSVRFGPRDTELSHCTDGSMLLRSRSALRPHARRLTERLVHWAEKAPQRVFVAQRMSNGTWENITYCDALGKVRSLAEALLQRDLTLERPLAILSDNSIEHLLLALAAQHVGIPYSPISPGYSLAAKDLGRLRHVLRLLRPGLVFAQNGLEFERALCMDELADIEAVVASHPPATRTATLFTNLIDTPPGPAVDAARSRVGPDTVAKILFTSGSTGTPKGVVNTQRMLCANQQQIAQTFPFLEDEPPTLVDWLPWNHTFGGNHNVGIALWHGGSVYIDEGKPVAGSFKRTVANLREIAPTIYFNVPKGFEELIPYLRRDDALRKNFFSRLKMIFYAGAGLPQPVWDALETLAVETVGERIPIITGLGCTESGPAALFLSWAGGWSGLLGVPVPGLEVKLVPAGDKLEARYRGPNVTPGYWHQPELTIAAFDGEGFYRTGDALSLVDAADPNQGLVFDGRIAEDFKLLTGTWVSVGALRATIVAAAAPYITDAVIAGHDRDFIAAILFPNLAACRELCPELDANAHAALVIAHPAVRTRVEGTLDELGRGSTGSANRVARALITELPPSLEAGEITDKGSLNQRAVLKRRAELVDELYREPLSARVLCASTRGER
jgi:feruloyl-CoA synthase